MEIIFWQNNSGKFPVKSYFNQLDVKTQRKVLWTLDIVERFGIRASNNYFEKMKDCQLYEIRVDFNKKWHRILCKVEENKCYLLHGFSKKSNKTPIREINTALGRSKLIILNKSKPK